MWTRHIIRHVRAWYSIFKWNGNAPNIITNQCNKSKSIDLKNENSGKKERNLSGSRTPIILIINNCYVRCEWLIVKTIPVRRAVHTWSGHRFWIKRCAIVTGTHTIPHEHWFAPHCPIDVEIPRVLFFSHR